MPAHRESRPTHGAGVGKPEEKEPAGEWSFLVQHALWGLQIGAGREKCHDHRDRRQLSPEAQRHE